ncbi:MAG: prepilin-type N-terminal cleavage/methylation domain-containing protein [Shewanella sp.]|nr:prepilin-type N-terminal cleavage/methylation domain-containing protein [Shewanella sp.]MCF1430067.1 prepilin-type N-terminal cleavage/methylation domain-containing protein [Shewanella sp.]MCF1438982.1 prepilin-type N-terminal cleavage/methylation domain-containing protein [Shewanella sp.]MCF1456360.1 prepilin-type N-terminal cleavage/methylation domain-containing protein [Shewanella sp.]
MSRSKGFPLIELVVVIIILGILAAVAVSKFINMEGEARTAVTASQFEAFTDSVKLYHSGWLVGGYTGAVKNLPTFGDGDVDSTATAWLYGTEVVYSLGNNNH